MFWGKSISVALASITILACTVAMFAQINGPINGEITDDVAVVVREDNPASKITVIELRKIFSGQRRVWQGSTTIKLIVRAPGAREREILLRLLGMTETQYKQYWIQQIFRGEAQFEPVAVFSNGMQKEAVNVFPGSIALMRAGDVKSGMKVLKVEGHLPGDAEYPALLK